MKSKCLADYNLKADEHQDNFKSNSAENIFFMQVELRAKKYLCKPETPSAAATLTGDLLDKRIMTVVDEAQKIKRENVIKVMRSNTYFCGFSKEKLDVFTAPKSKVNMEEQIETLISAENDDAKQVTLFNYWQQSKKKKNFDAENFLEDLIAKNYAL